MASRPRHTCGVLAPLERIARSLPIVVALASLTMTACASLPKVRSIQPSLAIADTADTTLGRVAARHMGDLKPATGGIHLLPSGPEAFLARLALVERAETSLDLQYYIWHADTVGRVLLGAVLRAADRGVRVRILIDDIGSMAKDDTLLMVDSHPAIEVRLFNPASSRAMRSLWVVTDFSRVNRRMHNKSFIADGQLAIVGGRNIGDEYFAADAALEYGDLDALVIGSAVPDVSAQFDRYWNSGVSYGIGELRDERPSDETRAHALTALRDFEERARRGTYAEAIRESLLAQQILTGQVAFSPAAIQVKADDPVKVEDRGTGTAGNLMPQIAPELQAVNARLILISPYFVPRKGGLELLRGLRARGVRVTVLTNGLGSTDVVPVFAKYRKYRRPLLEAGVELFEVDPSKRVLATTSPAHMPESAPDADRPSPTALHGKILVFDCGSFFVGSMNLDPRSARLNTEVGIVVDAPSTAQQFCAGLDRLFDRWAYRLELVPDGRDMHMQWVGHRGGADVRYRKDPQASRWRRFAAWFYSLLPIESLM